MALSKITYDTKVALDPQPSVANINKVSDSDMNEIKSVVNAAIDQVEANQSAISDLIKVVSETINIGNVAGGGEIYGAVYTLANIPSGYKFVGILGWNLQGNNFTKFFITQLIKATDTTITWGIRNSSGDSTNNLSLEFTALYIKE